jgi:hypothetical protein
LLAMGVVASAQSLPDVLKQGDRVFSGTGAMNYYHGARGSAAGAPRVWSETRFAKLGVVNFDLAPDGKRIAGIASGRESAPAESVGCIELMAARLTT